MNDKVLVQIVPTPRQIKHQQLEFYAFIHFTVNTFTGKEWGDGTEDEAIFNPVQMDSKQWVQAVKSAGMKGLILTCKHHDGFCLWPSKYTKHTIANSPYKDGKGDIVREVSDACKEEGLEFGVYLSPWDRNQPVYGQGKEYDDYFVNQLTELLTEYGDVFSVWFDGACGEGQNGKKQKYDWERYYSVIRQLQPSACISVCGPDVRWCGNEAGDTRPSEWSVVPKRTSETESIASNSQQADKEEFRQRKIKAQDQDLGSRKALADENDLIWYPAEVNTSIRPGWFYHSDEDSKVRTVEQLVHIYENSVGGNGTFLLNVPPMPTGRIHENDERVLRDLGNYLKKHFDTNLIKDAKISSNQESDIHPCSAVITDDYENYFCTKEGQGVIDLSIELSDRKKLAYLVLKENICLSQRIEKFSIIDDNGNLVYEGTTVGYKKIIPLNNLEASKITIQIKDYRVYPTLSFVGLYEA